MAVHFTKKISDPKLQKHVRRECARALQAYRRNDFTHPRLQEFVQREFVRASRDLQFKIGLGLSFLRIESKYYHSIDAGPQHRFKGYGLTNPIMGFLDYAGNPIRANRRVRQWLLDNKLAVQTAIAQQHGSPSYSRSSDPFKRLLFNADYIEHFYRSAERPSIFQYFWHGGVDFVESVDSKESRWYNPNRKKIEPLTQDDLKPGWHASDTPELAATRRRLGLA